jgi:hypothetical protein
LKKLVDVSSRLLEKIVAQFQVKKCKLPRQTGFPFSLFSVVNFTLFPASQFRRFLVLIHSQNTQKKERAFLEIVALSYQPR